MKKPRSGSARASACAAAPGAGVGQLGQKCIFQRGGGVDQPERAGTREDGVHPSLRAVGIAVHVGSVL